MPVIISYAVFCVKKKSPCRGFAGSTSKFQKFFITVAMPSSSLSAARRLHLIIFFTITADFLLGDGEQNSICLSSVVNHKCESRSDDCLDHSYIESALDLWHQTQRQAPRCYRLSGTSRHTGCPFPLPARMLYRKLRETERTQDVHFRRCPRAPTA